MSTRRSIKQKQAIQELTVIVKQTLCEAKKENSRVPESILRELSYALQILEQQLTEG